MSLKRFEETCEIMNIIADNYGNPEKVLEKLSGFETAPKSPEEIEIYVQSIFRALIYREFNLDNVFPNLKYHEIVESLAGPLKTIFEKTPSNLILKGDVKERMVGIHPFFSYFYKNFSRKGFSCEDKHIFKKLDVNVIYGPTYWGFDGVEIYLSLSLFDKPWRFYICFNESDIPQLAGLNWKGNKLVAKYKIKDHLDGSVSIEILKPEEKKMSVVMQLPELFSEIKEDVRELRVIIGSHFESYYNAIMVRENLIKKLEEVHLETESFYEKLVKSREADKYVPPDAPLVKSDQEIKKLLEAALIELGYYIKNREEAIKAKRENIMKKLMRE